MKKVPILLVGAPGIGKTEITKSKYDYCEILLLSSQTEEDIAGIPYRNGENEKRAIPRFIQRLKEAKGKRCLFLDEIDKARREVADTLLTLITNQEYFGIDSDVDIIAAANPPEWGGGDGLSMPMLNRFSVINFEPDFDEWREYVNKKYNNSKIINKIMDRIENKEIPFLEHNGEGLSFRLTCPRSLDMAFSILINDNNVSIKEKEKMIYGVLTPNVASGICNFIKINNRERDEEIQEISRGIGSKKIKNILRK